MKSLTRLTLILALAVLLIPLAEAYAQAGTPPTARVLCAQYVRQGASTEASRIGLIEPGPEVLTVLAHNPAAQWREIGVWVLIEQPSSGLRGWMADGECLAVRGDLTLVPEVREVGYQGPPLANILCDQYLRDQPEPAARPLAVLFGDEPALAILGRDRIAEWLYVQRASGERGWMVDTDCVTITGNVWDAPLVEPGYEGPLVATLACTQYLRLEPDNEALRLSILYPGDGPLAVVGRDVYANWFLLVARDGRLGWAYNGSCLVIHGDILDAPYPPPAMVNNVALVPSEDIGNVPEVGPPVTISGIPGVGAVTVPGAAPLPFAAPAEAAPAAPAANAVGGPGQAVEVVANCDQTGGLAVRAGSAVRLVFRWETTDPAFANDWLQAQSSRALFNGAELSTLHAHLTSAPVENRETRTWVVGYFYPLGELAPGVYSVHWDVNLSRAVQTGWREYAAGGYAYDCTFTVQ